MAKSFELGKDSDKETRFMHDRQLPEVDKYNECIEKCNEPIHKLRFELEF